MRPASKEHRKALYDNMVKTIFLLEPVLKTNLAVYESLKVSDERDVSFTDKKILFSSFLSLSIYSQYINLELISVLKSCFRATPPYEKRYNLKFINIVILEGYKHLYGYKSRIKESLWYKLKLLLDVVNDEELKNDCLLLDKQIKTFGEENVTNKDQRDFAVHYDFEPTSVYKMLVDLSEEEEIQRVLKFGALLDSISAFALKYQAKYQVDVKLIPSHFTDDKFYLATYNFLEYKKSEIYSSLEKHIESQSEKLDYFVKLQKLPGFLKTQFKDVEDDFYFYIDKLSELIKVSIQLLFLYIDLASATRAFISSEYIIEKQISLKQMNIIIYEGFNKLYGFKEGKSNAFFHKYLQPIIAMIDDNVVREKFTQLQKELNSYEVEIKAHEKQRHMSVHYDEGVDQVYSMLQNFNPLVEFSRAKSLLNLLPKIFDCSSDCVTILNLKQTEYYKRKNAKTNESIDKTIELLESHSQTLENEKFIQFLKDVKSGDYLKNKFSE